MSDKSLKITRTNTLVKYEISERDYFIQIVTFLHNLSEVAGENEDVLDNYLSDRCD